MACGTPVVATGVGGSGEFLVDRSNCLRFTPGDEVGLADAVIRMADDPELRMTLRSNGWVSADQFDLSSTIDAYEACHVATAEHHLDTLTLAPHPSAPSSPSRPTPANRISPRMLQQVDQRGGPVLHVGLDHNTPLGITLVPSLQQVLPGRRCVVADATALPFRDGAFAGLVCQDTVERVADDRGLLRELARICRPGGTAVIVVPNRRNAATIRPRLCNWWRGWRRSPAQYVTADGQLRAYTWAEFEALVSVEFSITRRVPIGWGESPRRRVANSMLVGPLRAVSHSMLLEGRRK
jgi:SAM-dependent methyltransferase